MNEQYLLIAGIAVLAAVFVRLIIRWHRAEAQRKAERHSAAQKAREVALRQERQNSEYGPNSKNLQPGSRVAPERVPLSDPFAQTLTGSVSPQSIAKWEAEIHQIGRQMIGQLDSKMVALQTLTMEANRAANRLEILVEHLENLAQGQQNLQSQNPAPPSAESKKTPASTPSSSGESSPTHSVGHPPEWQMEEEEPLQNDPFAEFYAENLVPQTSESAAQNSQTPPQTLIHAEDAKQAVHAAVFDELDGDKRAGKETRSNSEKATSDVGQLAVEEKRATILQPLENTGENKTDQPLGPEPVDLSLRMPTAGNLASGIGLGMERSEQTPSRTSPRKRLSPSRNAAVSLSGHNSDSPLSHGAASMPGGRAGGTSGSGEASALPHRQARTPLSVGSLFDDNVAARDEMARARGNVITAGSPKPTMPPDSHVELRRQIELLSDYGYSPRQIAQSLEISVGEVDLVLNLRK